MIADDPVNGQQAAPVDLSHLATDELDARVLKEQGIFVEFEDLVLTRTSQGYLSGVQSLGLHGD